MRLLERSGERVVFQLGARERTFFERLLSFYPLRPEAPVILSRGGGPGMAGAEGLLAEAQEERRGELEGWLRRQFVEGRALERDGEGWRLALAADDVERLLQVLNELRVGAWARLGSPDDLEDETLMKDAGGAPLHAIMTLAGQIQIALLHAWWGEAPGGGETAA